MESLPNDLELIADPVSHISISGFHGVDEIVEHLDSAHTQDELNGVRRGPSLGTLLLGAALGAAVMYLLDPDRGRRRRALARDKAVHLAHVTGDRAGKLGRHWRNRAVGGVAEIRGRLSGGSGGADIATTPAATDVPTA